MEKILIIKLGALGDVIRTLSILPGFKEKFPNSEIFWLTKNNAAPFLENNPYINKLLTLPFQTKEKFDILYNFDTEEEATSLAKNLQATKKYGFYSEESFSAAFNPSAEYYLNTMFDDELKKNNKKTYQQMMFEAAELDYKKQHCSIFLTDKDKNYARDFLKNYLLNKDKLIGIHIGSSPRWPSKSWHEDRLRKFIILAKQKGYDIILFGGPEEKDKLLSLVKEFSKQNIKVMTNNPDNTMREFASLVNECSFIISADSLALHVALALKKKTIGLFFCTSSNEIEDYGLLQKLCSPMLYDFFPERMNEYNEELTKSITEQEVLDIIEKCHK